VTEFGDPQRQGELDKHAVVPPYITCWLAPTCSVPEVAQTQRARVVAVVVSERDAEHTSTDPWN
jgi:hypothetical protein